MRKIYFKPILKSNIYGIKCDECYWVDDSIEACNYDQWINKPCPVCGANLLKEADYKLVMFILKMERWFGWIRIPSFKRPDNFKLEKHFGRWRMDDDKGNSTWLHKS